MLEKYFKLQSMTLADLSHCASFQVTGIQGHSCGRFFEVGFFVGQCGTLVRRIACGHAFIVRIGQACVALRACEARCLQVVATSSPQQKAA